jgi:cell division protein FtsL
MERNSKPPTNEIDKKIALAKLVSICLLIAVILSVLATIYFFYELKKERNKTELTNKKLELTNKELELVKEKLVEKNNRIAELLQKLPEKAKPETSQEVKLIRMSQNASYSLGLYAYGVSAEEFNRVSAFVREEGYYVTTETLLENKTSWLAPSSTVFYYHPDAEEKAKKITNNLTKLTGTEFKFGRGAGLAVVKGQEKWTFFVHYIGKK